MRPSAVVAGELRSDALGLPRGMPLVHGAADTAAALLVAGGRMLNLGTGAQLAQRVDEPLPAVEAPTCHRFRAAGDGWYALAAVQNAGLALDWARRVLGDEGEARAGGPLFVPHLTGERTPLLDPGARGAWAGLSLATDRAALQGSVREGVAFGIRWARDALDAEAGRADAPLRLLGGGSLRPGFAQLLADALDEPLELLDVADASALGAAWLAGAPAVAPRAIRTVEPRAGRRRSWRSASPPGARSWTPLESSVRGWPSSQRPSSPRDQSVFAVLKWLQPVAMSRSVRSIFAPFVAALEPE